MKKIMQRIWIMKENYRNDRWNYTPWVNRHLVKIVVYDIFEIFSSKIIFRYEDHLGIFRMFKNSFDEGNFEILCCHVRKEWNL